jgi:hypothetical protein
MITKTLTRYKIGIIINTSPAPPSPLIFGRGKWKCNILDNIKVLKKKKISNDQVI